MSDLNHAASRSGAGGEPVAAVAVTARRKAYVNIVLPLFITSIIAL